MKGPAVRAAPLLHLDVRPPGHLWSNFADGRITAKSDCPYITLKTMTKPLDHQNRGIFAQLLIDMGAAGKGRNQLGINRQYCIVIGESSF